jgi:hypothetical protein
VLLKISARILVTRLLPQKRLVRAQAIVSIGLNLANYFNLTMIRMDVLLLKAIPALRNYKHTV